MRTCYRGALLWPSLNTCIENAAWKVFFFEIVPELGLIDTVPPWYLPAVSKPIYESPEALALHRQGKQNGYSIYGPQDYKEGVGSGDVISMDRSSGKEVGREDGYHKYMSLCNSS